jgi:hypothetical protein
MYLENRCVLGVSEICTFVRLYNLLFIHSSQQRSVALDWYKMSAEGGWPGEDWTYPKVHKGLQHFTLLE